MGLRGHIWFESAIFEVLSRNDSSRLAVVQDLQIIPFILILPFAHHRHHHRANDICIQRARLISRFYLQIFGIWIGRKRLWQAGLAASDLHFILFHSNHHVCLQERRGEERRVKVEENEYCKCEAHNNFASKDRLIRQIREGLRAPGFGP